MEVKLDKTYPIAASVDQAWTVLGDILPTERAHITKKEAKEGCRLSCQVAVKQDMKIEVPHEALETKKWECEVISNDNVATFIKEFKLKLPEGVQPNTHV